MSYATIAISLLALFFAVLFNWVKATEKERSEVTSFTLKTFLLLLGVAITAYSITQVYDFYISVEPFTRKDVVNMVINIVNGFTVFLGTSFGVGYWSGVAIKRNVAK